MKLFFHKITNWEYWPFQVLYFPIYFLWGYYAIRAKSIFFFNASNPTIKNGGFMMESKKAIYDLLPKKYYPKTILIREQTDLSQIVNKVVEQEICFPLIVKPDIGLRGSGVKKIKTISELKIYVEKANFDFLVQDLIPYQNEVGIFYVRHPHEKEGRITGIVAKEFLIVKGDGVSSIEDLIRKTPRFMLQWDNLQEEYGDGLKRVLTKEEEINLVPFGNHARGAKFLDASNLISEKLTQTINEVSAQIPEFYFGRFDIMYNSIEELERGENFQIVELNGAASEPTHIYDPKHSVWFAWKELARHITYMYEISVANHKRGFPYLTHKVGMHQYRLHLAQNNKILNF
ncbi:ATP-grasp domain-containing protein [Flavobacterium geliluteum]|uniref:D-alanine--D-alanine ligase n=1 Tax=Flavobacterium geliluteum TaxID=2816120 RepID=A0A941AW32_9FLAO|nr:D-alanine--D-alanine ligase [Flavobacterium geliluteum]MBP4139299.1 D-alanine--D-alanine ligase [Flavobacterium geliluteum]